MTHHPDIVALRIHAHAKQAAGNFWETVKLKVNKLPRKGIEKLIDFIVDTTVKLPTTVLKTVLPMVWPFAVADALIPGVSTVAKVKARTFSGRLDSAEDARTKAKYALKLLALKGDFAALSLKLRLIFELEEQLEAAIAFLDAQQRGLKPTSGLTRYHPGQMNIMQIAEYCYKVLALHQSLILARKDFLEAYATRHDWFADVTKHADELARGSAGLESSLEKNLQWVKEILRSCDEQGATITTVKPPSGDYFDVKVGSGLHLYCRGTKATVAKGPKNTSSLFRTAFGNK